MYQVLLQTCIHPPVVEGEQKRAHADDGTAGVTYKSFTSLWSHILTLPREHAVRLLSVYVSLFCVDGVVGDFPIQHIDAPCCFLYTLIILERFMKSFFLELYSHSKVFRHWLFYHTCYYSESLSICNICFITSHLIV